MKWILVAVSTLTVMASMGFAPAQAYTCQDVRALSAQQRAYYIRVFNITPAQQERIRHACYDSGANHVAAAGKEHAARPVRAEQ
jgi:hypothetical protein